MNVEINVRGNGACPICKHTDNCNIQEMIKKTLEEYSLEDNPMELVIFSCPRFGER